LQAKRALKRDQDSDDDGNGHTSRHTQSVHRSLGPRFNALKASTADTASDEKQRNRLTSQFDKLSRAEVEENKQNSMKPIDRLPPEQGLTMSFEDAYSVDVDIPVRPTWKYGERKEELERKEKQYFIDWLDRLQKMKDQDSVSLYEKNLEVWRQLWRVVEISDILLMVVDIRHPVLHFPPSLYKYITQTTGKPLVVVLNKTDLVTEETVVAWKGYFKREFPAVVLTTFCCYREKIVSSDADTEDSKLIKKKHRRRVYDTSQVGELFDACRGVCSPEKLSLVDWDAVIARYADNSVDGQDDADNDRELDENSDDDDDDDEGKGEEAADPATTNSNKDDAEKTAEGHVETVSGKYVTIGLVGHPNVGKSTVINSIMGRTVVSTSRTPGHTKHFQTIHVTPTLRLCDCPGLVFPCMVQRPMQILAGLYNIAQVQEPYTSVMYLAERVPLEKMLSLQPANTSGMVKGKWSAWGICEAFAVDRGFYTSKAARPDIYRAALQILRWELDGRVLLSFKPPGFFNQQPSLSAHADHNKSWKKKKDQFVNAKDLHHDNGQDAGGENDLSSDNDDDEDQNNASAPIAQQSAFALLEEEYC
ncbi:hypothetical protein IWW45_006791, partial [Coemansia sp. RSA 485]